MFFTHVCRLIAVLGLLIGVSSLLIGLAVANGWTGLTYEEGLAKYLPNRKSSGEAIDKGSLYIVVSVALGTLAEISIALRK